MPFPKSQRVLFGNNPLDQVVCQLRFPTILSISANAPSEFQEKIRNDYPIFELDPAAPPPPPEIADMISQFGGVQLKEQEIYKFFSEDQFRYASLNQGFIALTETRYSRWEKFYAELENIRTGLEEVYRPSFYTRIGLRYIDVINKKELGLEQLPWSELLIPEIAGVLNERNIGESIKVFKEELIVDLSADVENACVHIRHGIKNNDLNVYLIDSDFYTLERRVSDDIPRILEKFDAIAGNLFRWSITDQLREVLQPTDI